MHAGRCVGIGQTKAEHDQWLKAVFERIKNAGATLNADKCEFSADKVKFLGHIIDNTGIHPDPDKVCAIQQWRSQGWAWVGMCPPNIKEQRHPLSISQYCIRDKQGIISKRDILATNWHLLLGKL